MWGNPPLHHVRDRKKFLCNKATNASILEFQDLKDKAPEALFYCLQVYVHQKSLLQNALKPTSFLSDSFPFHFQDIQLSHQRFWQEPSQAQPVHTVNQSVRVYILFLSFSIFKVTLKATVFLFYFTIPQSFVKVNKFFCKFSHLISRLFMTNLKKYVIIIKNTY